LVRDPTQTTFDLEWTTPPITPFETGFLGYERAQIRDFVAEERLSLSARRMVQPNMYALLDERSIDESGIAGENTVVLGRAFSSLHSRDPETMT
jgi:hypothetical protein